MHSWRSLRDESVHSLHQPDAERDFRALRAAGGPLARFADADDLLRFLHDARAGDPEEKNGLLAALIRAALDDPRMVATVRALLFVALFPALDRIFRALLPHVPNAREPEARLTNDIFWAFHLEIESWDFAARSRVAATLQLNVRRKIKARYIAEIRPAIIQEPAAPPPRTAAPSPWAGIVDLPADAKAPDIGTLREALRARSDLSDIDVELVLGRFVRGLIFSDLAQELGIKEENARQRFRRAIFRLRFKKNRPV